MAKTTPTSIRFDEDQLAFIKKKEKIDSPQKVVNFLLNLYWWQHNYRPPYAPEPIKDVSVTDLNNQSKGVTNDLNEKESTNYTIDTKSDKGKKESPYLTSRRKLKS